MEAIISGPFLNLAAIIGVSTMQHRSNTTGQVHKWISAKTCWHLDVWLYEYTAGDTAQLLVRAETSAGGTRPIGGVWWRLHTDHAGVLGMYTVQGQPDAAHLKPLAMGTPAQRWICPQLEDEYWRVLYPLVQLWPRGDFKRRSVRLHFVMPTVPDPMDGMRNAYGETGRAARDAGFAQT